MRGEVAVTVGVAREVGMAAGMAVARVVETAAAARAAGAKVV